MFVLATTEEEEEIDSKTYGLYKPTKRRIGSAKTDNVRANDASSDAGS